MRGSTYSGIGSGLQQIGGMLMNYSMNKMEDERYQKRLDAAEKAREAREQSNREREEALAKITQVGRRTYMDQPEVGPGILRVERLNKFGDVIGTDVASPGEQSEYRRGFLADLQAATAAKEKEVESRRRFDVQEAGRNQRHRERMARQPATPTQAKPPRMEFREVPRPDGTGIDIIGFDPITGEEVMRNGRRRDASAPPASADDFLSRF